MNRNEQANIRERLRRLRTVAAPPQFETLLHQKIRAVRSRNRYLGWFMRPAPVALIVAVGALLVAAYSLSPFYSPNSSPVPGDGPSRVPSGTRMDGLPAQNLPGKARIATPYAADSSSADSESTKKNDVNTSKMP